MQPLCHSKCACAPTLYGSMLLRYTNLHIVICAYVDQELLCVCDLALHIQ
jgi:hypothetical protein